MTPSERLDMPQITDTSDNKTYIVYDEGSRPYPDEVAHITSNQIRNELVAKIQEKIENMNFIDLLEMAKQVNIVVEEIQ